MIATLGFTFCLFVICFICSVKGMSLDDFIIKVFMPLSLSVVAIICVIILPVFIIPVQYKATIKAFKWERTTYIKEYQTVCEEGWCLPEGAKEISHEQKEWGKSGSGTTLYADWYVYNIDDWVIVKEYQDNGEGRKPDSVNKETSDIPEKNTITEPSLGDKCQSSDVYLIVIAQRKDNPELTFRETDDFSIIYDVKNENKQVGDEISYGSTNVWHLIFS